MTAGERAVTGDSSGALYSLGAAAVAWVGSYLTVMVRRNALRRARGEATGKKPVKSD